MPKISGTRKDKAAELLARVQRGPMLSPLEFDKETIEKVEHSYRLWVSTWILSDLEALIPELRATAKTLPQSCNLNESDKLMKLNEIAEQVNAHLKRFEADPQINVRKSGKPGKRFFDAAAFVSGRYVSVRYISYQGISNLSKADAIAYLRALDDGSTDRHYEALRAINSTKENDNGTSTMSD